ncbi:MAG: hypothetical protein PHD40_03340 [Syntrophomonadaceae bacterium]|nr:hypothetical protein [Syntrophomonadaceae bacterium]
MQSKDTGRDDHINIPEDLQASCRKILYYGELDRSDAELFLANLEIFINQPDKNSLDKEGRRAVAVITPLFYQIYQNIIKKGPLQNHPSKLIKMFLMFGYMDERLLKEEQINDLYQLSDELSSLQPNVYLIKDWLEQIYKIEKEPSINEFGQDYHDVFRQLVKDGEMTNQDKSNYEKDADARLKHETLNLFRLGQKICYARVSGYIPILHSDMIDRDLPGSLISPAKLEAAVDKVLQVDFSAFHRELVYNNPEARISKELVMVPVKPELILIPTFGENAVMWQELTGRLRNSPARFIFPIFSGGNIDNLMISVIARFRWDLSKSMAGLVRDNVRESSLVNDYTDYIQFYKKNRDLSDEAKAKVKMQIDRKRNNIARIFEEDYYTWMNYESQGLLRLNKVARTIMFKYCPFAAPIRTNLLKHPLYSSSIAAFEAARERHSRILRAHYAKISKSNQPLDGVLQENLIFYEG